MKALPYQGEWRGTPQRVMLLDAWPRKLPNLAAGRQAARQRIPTDSVRVAA